MSKILIIQPAYLGDVILITSLIETLSKPENEIHILVRSGSQKILKDNPHLKKVWVWNKKEKKYGNLLKLIQRFRQESFDTIINPHRYFNTGLLTAFSKAKQTIGFTENPLSFLYTYKIDRPLENPAIHEIHKNLELLKPLGDFKDASKPRLYWDKAIEEKIAQWQERPYIVIAPKTAWFTKDLPLEAWEKLIEELRSFQIFLVGGPDDHEYFEKLKAHRENVFNFAGTLDFRETAAFMRNAVRVFAGDSSNLHIASSVNAKVTAFFLSTDTRFGYGPLSDDQLVISNRSLECWPCTSHGKRSCPLGHFKCSEIDLKLAVQSVLAASNP